MKLIDRDPEGPDEIRRKIQAKIHEGLDALERSPVVDGEAFFAKWRARLQTVREASYGSNPSNPGM